MQNSYFLANINLSYSNIIGEKGQLLVLNLFSNPFFFFSFIAAIIIALTVHEYAHAWASDKLGDSTAKHMGRLSLNPMAHLDPIGTIFLLLVGFGWGKPVPVNERNFKNPKIDSLKVSISGPLTVKIFYSFRIKTETKTGGFLASISKPAK